MTAIFKKSIQTFALASLTAAGLVSSVSAQSTAVREANAGRIGLLSESSVGTAVQVGDEIARKLDGQSKLRIVQYLSNGTVQNLNDLLNFRFADMAILNSDVLISEKLRNPDYTRLEDVKYLARLFTNELHVIVRDDSNINTIYELSGRNISIGNNDSGTSLTSRLVLRSLGVRPRAVELPTRDSIAALKRGDLDAAFVLAGKPNKYLASLSPEDGLRLLEIPLTPELAAVYHAAEFTTDDYPALVSDKLTNAISVDVVLAVDEGQSLGLEEKKKLTNFVTELNTNLQVLRNEPGHHPKWAEFSFEAEVPTWTKASFVDDVVAGRESTAPAGPSIFELMQTIDE